MGRQAPREAARLPLAAEAQPPRAEHAEARARQAERAEARLPEVEAPAAAQPLQPEERGAAAQAELAGNPDPAAELAENPDPAAELAPREDLVAAPEANRGVAAGLRQEVTPHVPPAAMKWSVAKTAAQPMSAEATWRSITA